MIVLALDTSTRLASVAIVDGDGRVVVESTREVGRGADLLVAIDAACRAAAVAPRALAAVAIGAGPGSFTGLRVGMATAKGIAFAAGCPLWTAPSLAALVEPVLAADPGGVVVGVLDARRDEVYACAFRRDGAHTIALAEPRLVAPGALAAAFPTGARYVGDAAAAYPAALAALAIAPATPTAAAVARLALAGPRVDELATGAPSYVRRAEAEINYPDGVPGALRRR